MRSPHSYARREAIREPYDTILIVCEGSKTEPYYFNRLRVIYRLSSANVKVLPAPGSDPMSVVRCAEKELETAGYDRAYCVFDRNGHANYEQARSAITQSRHGQKIVAITSVPCFEVWVLLHFTYSASPFTAIGKESACDRVLKAVKKHFPAYAKGYAKTFDDLMPKLDEALRHGTRLDAHNASTGSNNPATSVHSLVNDLKNLK